MELADEAASARRHEDMAAFRRLSSDAFDLEAQAAQFFQPSDEEPTRSVLHRSAATLALDADRLRDAERLISVALAGNPPEDIAEELRDLIEQVHFRRHLIVRGIDLAPGEMQMSLAGAVIAHGLARSDAVLDRLGNTRRLLLRAVERVMKRPFRERGAPKKDVIDRFDVYMSVPRAASYALTLKVGVKHQLELPDQNANAIVDDFLECMELFQAGKTEELQARMREDGEAYYNNFVSLADRIAPDGKDVRLVGFTARRAAGSRLVAITRRRYAPEPTPAETGPEKRPDHKRVSGTLLHASARRRLKGKKQIAVDDGEREHMFTVPPGLMDDIVKPLWDERVTVTGRRIQGGGYLLEHITKIEEEEQDR